MKHLITLVIVIAAVLLMANTFTTKASNDQKGGEKSKGGNDQVKLYSDAVEVVEISDKVERCSTSSGATLMRLRVKSTAPIDVRIHTRTQQGRWTYSDYMNKKSDDEISSSECYTKARYKVQTRPAGNNDKWPKL